jgi:hypothetical protein
MKSHNHVIILGSAVYPTFGTNGEQNGTAKCWLFDRIWCVREICIRYRVAVKLLGHQKSDIIVSDDFLKEITSSACAGSGRSICADIAEVFREKKFFDTLMGRPDDVQGIKETLLSSGFFNSPEHFDEHFRKLMAKILTESVPQVCPL